MKLFFDKTFIVSTVVLSIVVYILAMCFYFETGKTIFIITSGIFGLIFTLAILNMPYKAEPRNEFGQTEAEYYAEQAEAYYAMVDKHSLGSIDLRK